MDGELLLRWVMSTQLVPGEFKVMSERFNKPSFSVDRESLKPLLKFRSEHRIHHVARFQALACREEGFTVRADPNPATDPANAAHALVDSSGMSNNARRRAAKRLRDRTLNLYESLESEK